jgi:hypothetical protein
MIATLAPLVLPGRASFLAIVNPSFEAVSDEHKSVSQALSTAWAASTTLTFYAGASSGSAILASDKNQVTPSSDSYIRELHTTGSVAGIADPSISGVVSFPLIQGPAR